MIRLAPPPPPVLDLLVAEDDGRRRLRVRLLLLWATLLTVLATAWVCTLGPIPAVFAIVTAKHVLVAILVMGLGVDARKRAEMT
jgi:hypothetical protein